MLWVPTAAVPNLMADLRSSADLCCNLGHLEAVIDTEQVSGDVTELASAATLGQGIWADVGIVRSAFRSTGPEPGDERTECGGDGQVGARQLVEAVPEGVDGRRPVWGAVEMMGEARDG